MTTIVTSAADQAYTDIKTKILDGELSGGAMVSEGAIADELGMSRTPVREAFLRLQVEGWMRLYPKRGALVVEVQPHEREDVIEARILIETDAVSRVRSDALRFTHLESELADLIEQQRATLAAGDLAAFTVADAAFHVAIVQAGGNRLLTDFYLTLRDRQQRMTSRSLWRRGDRAEAVIAEHAALSELVAAGDADGFRDSLVAHLRTTHRELLANDLTGSAANIA